LFATRIVYEILILFPIANIIIGVICRAEFDAGITVEDILLLVNQIDDLLSIFDRIEKEFVRGANFYERTGTIRGCLDESGFHDKLVVGIRNVTELLDVAS